ncbi:MAG: DNA primase [Rhodobacteraceae bacterium]|nr:DNA primase [Paracoccaceae bacterium]
MSKPIPRQFVDELNSRISISDIVGKFVNWDQTKTRASAGDYWACCPFHNEKTPSFHVTESRGTYYCFGCGEKGGATTFLMKQRGMRFHEAIEFLATEAGMTIPKASASEVRQYQLSQRLIKVNERAADFFVERLHASQGRRALDYLLNRGFREAALKRFRIGYAPEDASLLQLLQLEGFTAQEIVASGLAKHSDRGGGIYPTFRDRIIFPIGNAGDETIAFGGRAMNSEVPAKYLNSPKTEIFSKGAVLYNMHGARQQHDSESPLLVVEGYLDVVSLWQAGFRAAVSPLGTAVTSHQLAMLWRLDPTPVIALDGDEAGIRAATRLVLVALPMLRPGKSLKFCVLPRDCDPDDVLRSGGAPAFEELLEGSISLVDFLWFSELRGRNMKSPDTRALIRADIHRRLNLIENGIVKSSYKEYLVNRFFAEVHRGRRSKRKWRPTSPPYRIFYKQELASAKQTENLLQVSDTYLIEAALLAICILHPSLIVHRMGELEVLQFTNQTFQSLLERAIRLATDGIEDGKVLKERLTEEFGDSALNGVFGLDHISILPQLAADSDFERKDQLLVDLTQRLKRSEHRRALAEEILDRSKTGTSIASPFRILLEDLELESDDADSAELGRLEEATVFENGIAVPKSHISQLDAIVAGKAAPVEGLDETQPTAIDGDDEYMVAGNGVPVRKEVFDELKALVKSALST